MIRFIDNTLDYTGQALKYIAACLLLLVAILITVDVVMRFFFNMPIIGVAEVVANGIIIIAFLQLSYAVRIGGMLRSELLISKLGPRGQVFIECVTALLGMLLFALMAWASWDSMIRAIEVNEFEGHASFRVPTWPVRVIIVSCSILAVINYLFVMLKAIVYREVTIDEGSAAH